jgi:hypothetical protein
MAAGRVDVQLRGNAGGAARLVGAGRYGVMRGLCMLDTRCSPLSFVVAQPQTPTVQLRR